ncbi:hypothetical protein M406DRAFT_100934 [Cryphonectria parasitica EP155]|uniref:Uncharacterized protein n=1 Tax=Cryphonectria parasitica (strain ATCC 38755 / EP155) TaxID=660469 RepID=A0A9P5CUN6_CRYP1|nr:uncharacterized protein M406DRAFT_100934 [Cryphonectria parasitica EP155]KAF3770556.1 hypothetical protein M406DRAFT_100934 [Cryphonectria parasitica EP155]
MPRQTSSQATCVCQSNVLGSSLSHGRCVRDLAARAQGWGGGSVGGGGGRGVGMR